MAYTFTDDGLYYWIVDETFPNADALYSCKLLPSQYSIEVHPDLPPCIDNMEPASHSSYAMASHNAYLSGATEGSAQGAYHYQQGVSDYVHYPYPHEEYLHHLAEELLPMVVRDQFLCSPLKMLMTGTEPATRPEWPRG